MRCLRCCTSQYHTCWSGQCGGHPRSLCMKPTAPNTAVLHLFWSTSPVPVHCRNGLSHKAQPSRCTLSEVHACLGLTTHKSPISCTLNKRPQSKSIAWSLLSQRTRMVPQHHDRGTCCQAHTSPALQGYAPSTDPHQCRSHHVMGRSVAPKELLPRRQSDLAHVCAQRNTQYTMPSALTND